MQPYIVKLENSTEKERNTGRLIVYEEGYQLTYNLLSYNKEDKTAQVKLTSAELINKNVEHFDYIDFDWDVLEIPVNKCYLLCWRRETNKPENTELDKNWIECCIRLAAERGESQVYLYLSGGNFKSPSPESFKSACSIYLESMGFLSYKFENITINYGSNKVNGRVGVFW